MKFHYNQIAGKKPQRMEALSDGVFAVAFTLLVLEIRVPVDASIRTEHDLITAFSLLMPKMLSYFMSFLTLGIFWMGHSLQYQFIEKSDRNLNWISLFFLLFVSLIPFTTAFLSEHIAFKFAIAIYWLNILLLGVVIYIHWDYAIHHDFIQLRDEQRKIVDKAVRKRIVYAQSLYAVGALMCFVNTYISIGIIVAVQLNYAFGIISGKRKNKTEENQEQKKH